MKDILENRESLFNFYRKYCKKHLSMPREEIIKEFKMVIFMKPAFMPYFFVEEIKRRGYDLTEEKQLF